MPKRNMMTDMKTVTALEIDTLELKCYSKNNILIAEWPDVTKESIFQLKASLDNLLSYLRENNTKNLLIDVRKSKVLIPIEEYAPYLEWLILELTDTNLSKIARVNPADYVRKSEIDKREVKVIQKDYSVLYEEFNSYQEACNWLSLPI